MTTPQPTGMYSRSQKRLPSRHAPNLIPSHPKCSIGMLSPIPSHPIPSLWDGIGMGWDGMGAPSSRRETTCSQPDWDGMRSRPPAPRKLPPFDWSTAVPLPPPTKPLPPGWRMPHPLDPVPVPTEAP